MRNELYPLTFEPDLQVTVWGGSRLHDLYGKPLTDGPLGESWEVSGVPGRESVVAEGPEAGRRLGELVDEHRDRLVGSHVAARHGTELPLLLKLIDASADLSVQVHPDSAQADQMGQGARGKSEAWLILHAEPGARLVAGVTPGTDLARLELLVAAARVEECLRWVEVAKGDVVPVSPGTVHAIGKGVVLLELQQSSDTTYRLWDYGRLGLDGKPRRLHVREALAVVRVDSRPEKAVALPIDGPGARDLLHRDASVELQRWRLDGPAVLPPDPMRFWLATALEGELTLCSDSALPHVTLRKGRSALIPAGCEVELAPTERAEVFLGTVPLLGSDQIE